ncbi:MAG: HD domain-containing protein [Bryobacteraceae bacterium]|nr:HD domain-containing protein [Bryobacteraceae bacterium]
MENKSVYINHLPHSGEVTFLAVVIEKELRPKRNGGFFLSIRLADRSGELDAKVWDDPEAIAKLFDCYEVIKIRGVIEQYNGKPQLIVGRIRRCKSSEYVPADFYAASSRDPAEMFGELESFVAMVRDEALRKLLESIMTDSTLGEKLRAAPAALKIHHAFRGGLLEHILSLCNLAASLTAHYPRLNLDWLIAGAILHDLGKVETLELAGLRFAYTTRGQLIEHVALGLELLERHVAWVPDFPLDLKTILQHLIVSHHGDLDKGALRRPMFPEALALSLLDLMDARMEQAFRLIDSAESDEPFTPYVPSLERQLFRGVAPGNGTPDMVEGGKAA